MLLTEQEVDELRKSLPAVCKHQDVIRAAESAVLEKLKVQEPALVRYNKHMNGEIEPDPVERLRFFLSLALTGQNWLDVEKFLDDLPPDDVVRDAERYRWLRDSGKGDDLIRGDCRGAYLPESAALDAAIDAAMGER